MKDQIARLARRIGRTQDIELDCGGCSKQVPMYVESVLAGKEEFELLALVRQHLEQCTVCSQEYAILRDVVKMDLEDSWPTLTAMMEMIGRHDLDA